MNLVLINQFYPPSQAPTGRLLSDLAQALAVRGHDVTVITSPIAYNDVEPRLVGRGTVPGANVPLPSEPGYSMQSNGDPCVKVIRLGRPRTHKTGYLTKALDYLHFFSAARRHLQRFQPRPDALICMTTPPFCATLGLRMRHRHAVPYFVWCMDLYPEALAADGLLRATGWLYRCLMDRARQERESALGVVTLAPDMSQLVQESAPRSLVHEIPVWHKAPQADAAAATKKLRAERGWADSELILMYSGNLGRAHNWEAFGSLPDALNCAGVSARVVFCGRGPAQTKARQRLPDSIEWIAPVSRNQVDAHLLAADVHLIAQKPGWRGVVVPSKYQAACATGRPVLYAGPQDSAVAEWIRKRDTGWCWPDVMSGGTWTVTAAEIAARGLAAQKQWQDEFAPDLLLDRWVQLVEAEVKKS